MGDIYNILDMVMIHALAHTVTVVGASWSHGQEWLLRARVLRDSVHGSRSNPTAQRDDGVARQERRSLQINRIHGDLEQFVGMGRYGRLHMA